MMLMYRLTGCALAAALLAPWPARAQVTVDVAKITCEQWLGYKVADPDHIAIWLSGYYNGKRDNTVIQMMVFKENIARLRELCMRSLSTPVMKIVEGQLESKK